MQPSHKHHAQTQPQPQNQPQYQPQQDAPAPVPSAGPDINIPPPNAAPAQAPTTQSTEMAPRPLAVTTPLPLGMSSTQIVIAAVLVLVWAGLLIFARRLLTQSLVAQFADLGKSRGAGTAFYLFLLALGATVIVCSLGSYWSVLAVVIPAGVLDTVLLVVFLVSLGSARASRQRR